jgi:hypothetical protein
MKRAISVVKLGKKLVGFGAIIGPKSFPNYQMKQPCTNEESG